MQLAGLDRVICGEPIAGILDAEFCAGCGGPRHAACKADLAGGGARCGVCGVELARVPAARKRPVPETGRPTAPSTTTPPAPVSAPATKGWPKCGFGYGWDGRVCGHCRFEDPTGQLIVKPAEAPRAAKRGQRPTLAARLGGLALAVVGAGFYLASLSAESSAAWLTTALAFAVGGFVLLATGKFPKYLGGK